MILLSGCINESSDTEHVANAQQYIETGEISAAIVELKNAVQKNNKNAYARFLLGRLYLENGNYSSAEKELSKAIKFGETVDHVYPFLSEALLALRKHAELDALLVENLSKDSKVAVYSTQALGKLEQRDLSAATVLVDMALDLNATANQAIVTRARVYFSNRESLKARALLKGVFIADAENADAWSVLGDIEYQERQWPLAYKAYTRAIESRMANLRDRFNRAMVSTAQGNHEEAQRDVDILINASPNNLSFNYVQGIISYNQGRYAEALKAFEIPLNDESRYPLSLLYAGSCHLSLSNYGQAEHYANRFFSIAPDNVAGRKLLASLNLNKGNYLEAESLMSPVVVENSNDIGALNLLADALLRQKKTDQAVAVLNRAAELQPQSPNAQLRLGAGLLAGGEIDRGRRHLEAAVDLDPQYIRAYNLLVLNYLGIGEYRQAIVAAEEYIKLSPNQAEPYNLLGFAYIKAGQPIEAEQAFIKAKQLEPGNPFANDNLATLSMARKDVVEARRLYEATLKHNHNNLQALMKLATLDVFEGNINGMVNHLEQAIAAHPRAVHPKIVLARYYLTEQKPEEITKIFADLDENQRQNPAVLHLTALSQMARNQFTGARQTLEELVLIEPDNAEHHHLLARTYAELEERDKARIELEKTIKLAPNSFVPRLALARMLLAAGDGVGVNEHIRVLNDIAEDHPDVLQLESSVVILAGNHEKALALSEQAFNKSNSSSDMLVVADLKSNIGDQQSSYQMQESWVKGHPEATDVRLSLAKMYMADKKEEGAIRHYTAILTYEPDNFVALNNLAWLLGEHQPRKAVDYAKQALNIEPESAEAMDTLAMALYSKGNIGEADSMIRKATRLAPKNLTMKYHQALIMTATGKIEGAITILNELLVGDKMFAEWQDAVKLRDKLKAEKN